MALKRGLGKGLDSLIPTNVMMESEVKHATVSTASSPEEEKDGTLMVKPVSYTHLTLPTILRV